MKNSTGLIASDFTFVLNLLREAGHADRVPPILGLSDSLIVTLRYLRRNRVQADLAEDYGVSQPTISRAISIVTQAIAHVLAPFVPDADDIPTGTAYLVDGTLLPCWSWEAHPELYSGKHHTTGVNVQIVTTLDGRIAWVSDPLPGNTHDVAALDAHGILDGQDASQYIGDKGYIGRGMTTPHRKPQHQHMSENTKRYNKEINQLRWPIEQAIAHLKTWRILHTDYRRPLHTITTTITAVLGLYFLCA